MIYDDVGTDQLDFFNKWTKIFDFGLGRFQNKKK